jgi:hypothetical protein
VSWTLAEVEEDGTGACHLNVEFILVFLSVSFRMKGIHTAAIYSRLLNEFDFLKEMRI